MQSRGPKTSRKPFLPPTTRQSNNFKVSHMTFGLPNTEKKKKKKGVLFFSQVIFNHRILECCSKKGKSGFFKSFIFLFSREMSCFPCLSFEHVSCSVVFNSL